ncbi:MAG TPA: glucosamine-6-phosphate deaminase [Lentisphaeria bacterium]|nr:glucosamine-6-phosphate deaminase [Lentisphaeria bacterium]
MNVVIRPNEDEVALYAYDLLRDRLIHEQAKVLGLPTGSTPLKLYARIAEGFKRGEVDFSDVHTFNLDEYLGLPEDHPQSYRYFMEVNLFQYINLKSENIHFLDGMTDDIGAECEDYEAQMDELGGIKLQILGIGRDGHIGFNEPGTSLNSRTGYVTLTEGTIADNKRFFAEDEEVPRWALSMGVGTILDARELLLLATGANKADAIAATLEGPVTSMCTASALQLHPDVTVVIDEAAASKLKNISYYKKTADDSEAMVKYLANARKKAGLD